MLARLVLKRGAKPEGESPFWISFSDLMSALMVLFLVVMAVTLVAVTDSLDAATKTQIRRNNAIKKVMSLIAEDPSSSGVLVDQQNYRIDLGKQVRFESNSFVISASASQFLRHYVPVLLRAKETEEGREWMRRVVVEGFTDEDGTYLYNLRLSLDRSRSVVCSLFAKGAGGDSLTLEQLAQVQELFLVGGYSFNSIQKDKAASRRVEFKIDFWGVDEEKPKRQELLVGKEAGQC